MGRERERVERVEHKSEEVTVGSDLVIEKRKKQSKGEKQSGENTLEGSQGHTLSGRSMRSTSTFSNGLNFVLYPNGNSAF